MTILFAALQNSVLTIESLHNGDWKTSELLKGHNPTSLSVVAQRVFCGTWNKGVFKSYDGGQTWDKIDANILNNKNITSLACSSSLEGKSEHGKLFVGTEPSCLFISNDGGQQWREVNNFINLQSSSTWAFPPRPWTHHVRWIEPDKNKEGYIFVAIEAGALIQSHDDGKTWIDRVSKGPFDTHTLLTHTMAPARLYSAAGDGYFESQDYGETWQKLMKGIRHTYLVGMAINPADPDNIIVSAASGAWKAHFFDVNPESYLYRYLKDEEKWELVTKGLPQAEGTIISNIISNPKTTGEFYCLNNRGVYKSVDKGESWNQLNIEWSKEYILQHPMALAVLE